MTNEDLLGNHSEMQKKGTKVRDCQNGAHEDFVRYPESLSDREENDSLEDSGCDEDFYDDFWVGLEYGEHGREQANAKGSQESRDLQKTSVTPPWLVFLELSSFAPKRWGARVWDEAIGELWRIFRS